MSPEQLLGWADERGSINYDPVQHAVPVPEAAETKEAPLMAAPTEPVNPHAVPIVEATETVVSNRVLPPLPPPTLPPEVAAALGIETQKSPQPHLQDTNVAPMTAQVSSIFREDEGYFVDSLHFGTFEVRVRELSEETLAYVSNYAPRVEEATQSRVKARIAALLFNGLTGASPQEKEAISAISTEDAVTIKSLITDMQNKVLCEGISSWVEHDATKTARECSDQNKLGIGRKFRDDCLVKIFNASGFQRKDGDFLADSSAPRLTATT
ncbi:MAG: hypothetical protein EOO38_18260 [Cytophagaceae bacterium]|nr:MAG: hypothetical protein EOO38_18260 [Cytophagaceae bacterium]